LQKREDAKIVFGVSFYLVTNRLAFFFTQIRVISAIRGDNTQIRSPPELSLY